MEQPLLITWGEQAKEVPKTELEIFRELRPDAEVVIFDPSGSLPHDERAEAWCARVNAFLARAAHTRAVPQAVAASA
jgi:pimeloyl-ACP methyl ester carboxylesterase